MSYKNIITRAKTNKIRLREPLKIQTIQPKKNMKYAEEFGHAVYMLHILINYMVIYHTLTYLRDNPIDDQSYTYNILSHLSISGD